MLLARGCVEERPFGRVVGVMARRGASGQLTVSSDAAMFAIVLEDGHVVAASSPASSDSVASIALSHEMISAAQAETIQHWLAVDPSADELDVCASVAQLHPHQVHRLRRRMIARRASRMFGLEKGEFVMTSAISLPVVANSEIHVGAVIYHGTRAYLTERRLRSLAHELGNRFTLRSDAFDDLPYFGFGERERYMLSTLPKGLSLSAIDGIANEHERHVGYAMVYALGSCGALHCETAPAESRLARGTEGPFRKPAAPEVVPTATEPDLEAGAHVAFARGQAALGADRIDEAVVELQRASQLAPDEPSYAATLAWARFCAASDKVSAATETRRALRRAIERCDSMAAPRYYLGLVERILGRTEQALSYFREVLELEPKHVGASTEIRFLMLRRGHARAVCGRAAGNDHGRRQ
jgi:tetratricopeptide (TPR) repeat protein